MSCNYYFEKWKKTLYKLDELVKLDTEYQEAKAPDKIWCDVVQRMTGILGMYMSIYKEASDCYQHNLQVQKAEYLEAIIKAVVARILELKDQMRKFIGTEYQFMGHGLVDHKLTTYDVELSDVIPKQERDEDIRELVSQSIQKADDRKRRSMSIVANFEPETKTSQKINWWDDDNGSDGKEDASKGIRMTDIYELTNKEEVTAEMMETRKMATLIQACERSRKVIILQIYQKQKREKWEKELNGTLRPPARREIRERSATMIQYIFRAYFQIKRNRFKECKRDELLALRLCQKMYQKDEGSDMAESKMYIEKFKRYDKEWNENCDKIKKEYIKRKYDTIEDDIRDEIMHWFRKWFDEASLFYDIPKESDGGSILIVKEEIPSPEEWLEKYKAYLEEKRASKNKTAYELKYEKLEAKKEKLMQKKAEHLQKKMEEQMLKKMMKNPKFHPGYQYPISKKIDNLIERVKDYKAHWSDLDYWEEPGVKENSVIDIDINNAYMDAKIEIRKTVDVALRETFNILNTALKEDYKRNGEDMPEQIKEKNKRKKKERKPKIVDWTDIGDKLEELAYRGFLKEYPRIKIEDFIGDPNFAGDDLRCQLRPSEAFTGETQALWWERCRELSRGSSHTLLVGAKGSGKTTLVYILASMNDAVLYEIDPARVPEGLYSAVYLQEVARSIADCARATQPSVIYFKHLHKLFYTKAPPDEDTENLNLIKRCLLRKLMKNIRKVDKVVIAASCIDPWLARSKQMLKQFPRVVLLPNTNYSTVSILLNNWILDNHTIPRDLDVQSLAHVLQGYSFGHIKGTLSKFLSADRIVKIAAYGLPLHDIYDFFLESEESKIDYDKYLKWYTDKTQWGKKGKKLLDDQKEFQLLLEKYQQKEKKKKNTNSTISDISTNVSTLESSDI